MIILDERRRSAAIFSTAKSRACGQQRGRGVTCATHRPLEPSGAAARVNHLPVHSVQTQCMARAAKVGVTAEQCELWPVFLGPRSKLRGVAAQNRD